MAVRSAATLLRVPASTVASVIASMRKTGYQPCKRRLGGRKPKPKEIDAGARDSDRILLSLTRTALGISSQGKAFTDFAAEIARKDLEGCDVGDKYHSRNFFRASEFIAGRVVQEMQAETSRQLMPALGIPSDIGISFDGLGLGSSNWTRHAQLLVCGWQFVSCSDGQLHDEFIDARPLGADHRGPAIVQLLGETFSQTPLDFTPARLRQRLAAISADGACVRGGPDAQHGSTGAAEAFFRTVFPEGEREWVLWDAYHRAEASGRRACAAHLPAEQQFDVGRSIDNYFGINAGKSLYTSVVEEMQLKASAIRAPNATRTITSLAVSRGSPIDNYAAVHHALHARLSWAEQGRGAHSKTSLIDVCRTFGNLNYVCFGLFFRDIMGTHYHPFMLKVQGSHEPWLLGAAIESAKRLLGQDLPEALRHMLKFLQIFSFLVTYCKKKERGCHIDIL